MRIALPIAALAAIACFDAPSSQAQIVGNAPWCSVVQTGAGNLEKNCDYYSIEECRPNVIAGNRGFCEINPTYRPGPERFAHYRRHWRHRPRRHWRHHPRYR